MNWRRVPARVMRAIRRQTFLSNNKSNAKYIKKMAATTTKYWLQWTNDIAKDKREAKILLLLLMRWTSRDTHTRPKTCQTTAAIPRVYKYICIRMWAFICRWNARTVSFVRIMPNRMPRRTCLGPYTDKFGCHASSCNTYEHIIIILLLFPRHFKTLRSPHAHLVCISPCKRWKMKVDERRKTKNDGITNDFLSVHRRISFICTYKQTHTHTHTPKPKRRRCYAVRALAFATAQHMQQQSLAYIFKPEFT